MYRILILLVTFYLWQDPALAEKILSRKRRETQMCTYTITQTCETTVYDPIRCNNPFFIGCFRKHVYECKKYYLDCCEGDIMDQGKCYAPDEPCEECYTLTDCDGTVTKLTSRRGHIKSKNYPDNYPPNQDCTWTVRGARNSTVRIRIVYFRLQRRETSSDCDWDWQTGLLNCNERCVDWLILQGGDEDTTPAVQECGSKRNFKDFNTMASVAKVHFHSNERDSEPGFHLVFTIIGGAEPPLNKSKETTTAKPLETTSAHETTTPTEKEPVVTTTPSTGGESQICPGKLIWDPCPRCTRTCNNLDQSEEQCRIDFRAPGDPDQETRCTPGCACPKAFPVWHKLGCVAAEECRIEEKIVETDACQRKGRKKGRCLRTCDNIAMDEKQCEKITLTSERFVAPFVCICPKGQYMLKDRCVSLRECQLELNKRCPAGQVWTSCLPQCTSTCTTWPECSKVASPCVAGCVCPDDRPILHEGSCIRHVQCPDRDVICGKQFYEPILKILGGRKAVKGSWPWIVQIEKQLGNGFALACGGTLICERWILTASHCFLALGRPLLETQTHKYRLHIGKHFKQYAASDEITGMIYNIQPSRIITHPKYSPSTHINDIALVELPRPVKLTKLIRPACIHNVSDYEPIPGSGKTCISMGWGAETNDENAEVRPRGGNQVLKQVTLSPRNFGLCSRLFLNFDVQKMHCVGGHENHDTCSGDSGGPLMCLRDDNRWYVDGVVSFGLKCGVRDQPGVYTRVTQYLPWIQEHAGVKCGNTSTVWNSST